MGTGTVITIAACVDMCSTTINKLTSAHTFGIVLHCSTIVTSTIIIIQKQQKN